MFTIDESIKYWRSQHLSEDQGKFDERLDKDYDGFHGMLPNWMLDENKREFLQAREQIIFYEYEDQLDWILDKINIEYNFQLSGTPPNSDLPDHIEKHILTLGRLKYLSEQPPEEIIEKQFGEGARNADKSRKQSERAKKNRTSSLNIEIEKVIIGNNKLVAKEIEREVEGKGFDLT